MNNALLKTSKIFKNLRLYYICSFVVCFIPAPVNFPMRQLFTSETKILPLMLGKIEGGRRRGCQSLRWLADITDVMDINFGKLQEMVRDIEVWHLTIHGVSKSWTRLGDWITKLWFLIVNIDWDLCFSFVLLMFLKNYF